MRTSSLGDSSSDDQERSVSEEVQRGARLCRCLLQGAGNMNIKRLLLIKENQISCIKEFSALLCMERCKHSGLLKSALSYASQLSEAKSYFLIVLILDSSFTVKGGCLLCFLEYSMLLSLSWGGSRWWLLDGWCFTWAPKFAFGISDVCNITCLLV